MGVWESLRAVPGDKGTVLDEQVPELWGSPDSDESLWPSPRPLSTAIDAETRCWGVMVTRPAS